jgi:hypothetical protein
MSAGHPASARAVSRALGLPPGVVVEIDDPAVIDALIRGSRHKRALIAARVRRGDLVGALNLYGHADRLNAVVRWWQAGRGPLRDVLAQAWTSTEWPGDPIVLWRAIAAGDRIEDGEPMPTGDPLTIYRGQGVDDEYVGISWTLDRSRAEWFAATIPRVGPREDGVVIEGRVARSAILGYLTARNESEVIVDPLDVAIVG